MKRWINNWLNRNVGPEGCAGCTLALTALVLMAVLLVLVLAIGFYLIGPILEQITRAL